MKRLFLNHMDAWSVALTIVALALYLHDALNGRFLLLIPAIGSGYWLAFAINDYFDAPFDAHDDEKAQGNFFVNHSWSRRALAGGLLLLAAGITAVFAQFGLAGITLVILCFAIAWGYSAPPLRFKNRPGTDLLVHAFFVQTFPYVICLALIGAEWKRLDWVILTILFLASFTAQLEQQVRDFDVDAQSGGTFVTMIGRTWGNRLLRGVTAVLITTAALFIVNGTIPLFLLPFGAIGLPALLHRFLRDSQSPRLEWLVNLSTTTGLLYAGAIYVYALLT